MRNTFERGAIEPRWGYFYDLQMSDRDPEEFNETDVEGKMSMATAQDEEDGLILRRISGYRLYRGFCCANSYYRQARCKVDVRDGCETGPIAWAEMTGEFFCNEQLAVQLLTSGLIGLNVSAVDFVRRPGHLLGRWFQIASDAPTGTVKFACRPDPYKCFNCGCEPICRKCRNLPPECPNCKVRFWVSDLGSDAADERKLLVVTPKDITDSVVDVQGWDGSDYFGGIITHRMLQYLLSVHAHPFRVFPVAVNVLNATAADLEKLESSKSLPVK